MPCLPDTNIWIYYFKRPDSPVAKKLHEAGADGFVTCAPVLAELLHGAHKYGNAVEREKKIRSALLDVISYPFDDRAAVEYARIRDHLERDGRVIGNMDLQIAAIALVHGLTVVTHNTEEFSRVPGLSLEDWLS